MPKHFYKRDKVEAFLHEAIDKNRQTAEDNTGTPGVESKLNQQTFTHEESYQYHQGKLPQTAKSGLIFFMGRPRPYQFCREWGCCKKRTGIDTSLRGRAKDACLLGIQACCNMASGGIAKETGERLLTFREFLAKNRRY